MRDYLKDTIEEFPEDFNKNVTTPAAAHLFDINKDKKELDNKAKQMCHTYVTKLLFASKQERPDIQVAIAFLSIRVIEVDHDDWKKLS